MKIHTVSSLIKIRTICDISAELPKKQILLGGEEFSYQIAVETDADFPVVKAEIDSPLKDFTEIYNVKSVAMDMPEYKNNPDTDYLTHEPGLMPDILYPVSERKNNLEFVNGLSVLWIRVKIPRDYKSGTYKLTVKLYEGEQSAETAMEFEVLDINMPKQSTWFTQWFYADCIAAAHNTEIYSEKHWELIDKYMAAAADIGVNTILTPVITPPLDTKIGMRRPNVQLVKILKKGDKYEFDFSLLERWLNLCDKHGIKYYEISHLFSQWGLVYSPNISAIENGKEKYIFGWDVKANDIRYKSFLEQFLPKLVEFFESKGKLNKCLFHLSDEPTAEHLENYKYAYDIVKPLIKDCEIMDAISNVDFYKKGYMTIPVTASNHIEPFLKEKIEKQCVYYCCAQDKYVGNRFMAMPSYRNRILGLQMYKYSIMGFLHWGFNFYYRQLSMYKINPYVTTSAGGAFPSGDAFSVYPDDDKPLLSLRAVIFKEALQEVDLCKLLESYIGRDEVIKLMDRDTDITFSDYPRNYDFLPDTNRKLKEILKSVI